MWSMSSPSLTRRQLLRGAAAGIATVATQPGSAARREQAQSEEMGSYADDVLPPGVR